MSNQKPHMARGSAWSSALLALAVAATPMLCEAAAQSQVDRTDLALNEPLTLTIVSDSARSGDKPDLSALSKDFAVLGSEQASEMSIINGTRSDRMRWTVRLMPLHEGSVEIPAITVGSDRTAPIDLTVTPLSPAARADAAGHAFLEVDTVPTGRSTFLQQSIPYTVRLFVDGSVQSGELTAPDAPDAAVEQIGKDKRYTASRHGRDYNVIERSYVISPEKSGALVISPARFQGTAVLPTNQSPTDAGDDDDPAASLMARMLRNSPFGNDPMFRSGAFANLGMPQATRPLTAQAERLTLDVRPRPAGAQGSWLPAQSVVLHDSWQDAPPQFQVGEPVTRVITIEVKGVAGSQIPTLAPAAPASARVYAESSDNETQIEGETVGGISKQTSTYIPSAEGPLNVPALDLAWWDTKTGTQRTASLPAARFSVAPGAGGVATPTAPTQATAGAPQGTASTITSPSNSGMASLRAALQGARADGRWLAGGIAALVLAAVAALVFRRTRSRGNDDSNPTLATPAATSGPTKKAVLQALRQACAADDGRAAAKALLALGRLEWPLHPPRGLAEMAARVTEGAAPIAALDRNLYGAVASTWNGRELGLAVKDGLRTALAGDPREAADMEALYAAEGACSVPI